MGPLTMVSNHYIVYPDPKKLGETVSCFSFSMLSYNIMIQYIAEEEFEAQVSRGKLITQGRAKLLIQLHLEFESHVANSQ